MMGKRHLGALGILVMGATLALAPVAAAQEGSLQEADGVRYLSTGVGKDARTRVRSDLPLKVIFTNPKGEYYANVQVQITSLATKKTVSFKSEGPWLYVNLPRGTYSVRASVDGSRGSVQVQVGDKQTVVILRLSP